jgi:hypothetical protein
MLELGVTAHLMDSLPAFTLKPADDFYAAQGLMIHTNTQNQIPRGKAGA